MRKRSFFYVLAGLAFILLLVTYSNHFHNPFQFDDAHTIQYNDAIRNIRNIPSFFKDARTFSSLPANQIYRPGVTTLNAIDYWIGGKPDPDPYYFHISIFISYVLLGILLYFLFLKLFNESFPHEWNRYFALFGAAFYALHTANAETVNYIISRSDSFSTLMIVLSMVIYLYWPNRRKYGLYVIPVIIGFFVKEPTIMTAPLLIVYTMLYLKDLNVIQWFSLRGIKEGFSVVMTMVPLFVVIIVLFYLSKKMASDTFVPGGPDALHYILTQPAVILHYFNNFLLPMNLSADTDWQPVTYIFDDKVITGMLFMAALLVAGVYCSTRRSLYPIAFGIAWFLLALLPTSIVPLAEVLNDHRTFFPYIGLAMAAAWLFGLTVIRFHNRIEQTIGAKLVFVLIPSALICAHAIGTHHRNKVWSSGESLWYDVTQKSPANGRGLMNYGLALMAKADYPGAQDCFERAMKLLPNYSYLYVNMGILKNAMGKPVEAEANYKQALYLNSGNPECYYYYASWLKTQGRFKEALDQATAGLKVSPDHSPTKQLYSQLIELANGEMNQLQLAEKTAKEKPDPDNYINLSLAYYQKQQFERSIEAAKEALKIKPDCIEAFNNICSAYNMLGNYEEAIRAGQAALKINPDYQLAKNNVADAMSRKAKVDEILALIKKQPNEANYINLSLVYYNLGSYLKCAEAAEQALKVNPNSSAAYNNICSAYNMTGDWDKAIAAGEAGLKIDPDNQLLKNNLEVSKRRGK
ncbi:MAG: tetratricopeptide repeat protein [Bacteroidia bacterium]